MSYSFTLQAATKAEARTQAEVEFDRIVAQQPVHVQDKPAALAALDAYLALLADTPDQDIYVSCHGSVGYRWAPDDVAERVPLTSVAVGVSAYLGAKQAASGSAG